MPPTPWPWASGSALRSKRLPCPPPEATVTISVGVAWQAPGEEHDPRDLVERADQALYRAKRAGRNRVYGDADTTEDRCNRRA